MPLLSQCFAERAAQEVYVLQAPLFFGYSQPLLSAYSDGMCFVYVKHDVGICFFSSAKRVRGATSPSMLKMLSVTMMILEKS